MAKGVPALHPEQRNLLNWSPKENWVEKQGGLPDYINSIAIGIMKRGTPRERAIPSAINVCKRVCATGIWPNINKPVSPAIRGAACGAIAELKRKEAQSKGKALSHVGNGYIDLAKYSADQLRKLAAQGKTFSRRDRNYYIADVEDLKKAIRAVGRGKASHDAIRRYIIRRAKALGASILIPSQWNTDGSISLSGTSVRSSGAPYRVDLATRVVSTGDSGMTITKRLAPHHLRALSRLNRKLTKVGMPAGRRRKLLRQTASQLMAGKKAVALSRPSGELRGRSKASLDLAFNPTELRVGAGQAGGGRWTAGQAVAAQGQKRAQKKAPPRQPQPRKLTPAQRKAQRRQAKAQRLLRQLQQAKAKLDTLHPTHLNPHERGLQARIRGASNIRARIQAAKALAKAIKSNASARAHAERQRAAALRRDAAARARAEHQVVQGNARTARQAALIARQAAAARARAAKAQIVAARKTARAMTAKPRIASLGVARARSTPRTLKSTLY